MRKCRFSPVHRLALMACPIAALVSEPLEAQTLQADIDYVARELAEEISSLELTWAGLDGVLQNARLTDAVVNCASTKALSASPVNQAMILYDWPTTRMGFTGGPDDATPNSPWKASFSCSQDLPCVLHRSLDRKLNWDGAFMHRSSYIYFRDPNGYASQKIGVTLPLLTRLCALQQQAGGRIK